MQSLLSLVFRHRRSKPMCRYGFKGIIVLVRDDKVILLIPVRMKHAMAFRFILSILGSRMSCCTRSSPLLGGCTDRRRHHRRWRRHSCLRRSKRFGGFQDRCPALLLKSSFRGTLPNLQHQLALTLQKALGRRTKLETRYQESVGNVKGGREIMRLLTT